MVNLGVATEWGTFQPTKKSKAKKLADASIFVPKRTSPGVKDTTEEISVIDLALPRRRTSKQHTLAPAHRPQFVQPIKSKPIKAQVSEEVARAKRRKQLYCQGVPNTRLYQPPVPKFRRIDPPPTSKPARLPKTYKPKLDSVFTVYDNLTNQLQTQQKRKRRSSTSRRSSPLRVPLGPVQETTGRRSLVITVPAVNLLYESSPERTEGFHDQHRASSRNISIFNRVQNSLNSPDQLSEAGDHEFKDNSKTGSLFQKSRTYELSPASGSSELRAIASASSLFKAYINGHLNPQEDTAVVPEAQKAKVKRRKTKNMSKKDRGRQHSASPEDFSDGNESLSAPSEFLAEFLSAIMQRKYVSALKYCKLILQYEPNNVTAREFYPLLEEKLKTADKEEGSSGAELPSAENPPTDMSGDSNQNTEEKEDEGLSYNSDDSYVLDDELEEEGEDLEEEMGAAGAAGGADSPITSSLSSGRRATDSDRSLQSMAVALDDELEEEGEDLEEEMGAAGAAGGANSPITSSLSSGRRATDSDRSLQSSAGGEGETDNSNNQSGSGYEDEDSSKYEVDDDNGNAVSVTSASYLTAAGAGNANTAAGEAGAAAAGARFVCEGNDNDTASGAADTASNDNYRKNQEELRRHKIQQMRSQYVHSVK